MSIRSLKTGAPARRSSGHFSSGSRSHLETLEARTLMSVAMLGDRSPVGAGVAAPAVTARLEAAATAVSSVSLIDVKTGQVVPGFETLAEGAVLNLTALPSSLTLRANTAPATVGSVRFRYDNKALAYENSAPYGIAGDSGGKFKPFKLAIGAHQLIVTPYEKASGKGAVGTPLTVNFTVVKEPIIRVERFTLINADTDLPVPGFETLADGAVLNLATLPTRNLNIQAHTAGPLQSVRFTLDGKAVSTEQSAPFSLYGDTANGADFRAGTPTVGVHTLTVTPFTKPSAKGAAGLALTVGFEVIDQPTGGAVIGIEDISPANGEEMVGLERETIVRFGGAIDPATVTPDAFYLIANGQRVAGDIRVSSTEQFATFFYDQPLPAATEVRVVVDGERIVARNGEKLDADGDGKAGGVGAADFRTLPLTRIAGTHVFGFVYDSYNKNPDGSNRPVVGATIRVDAIPEASVVTDANGRFELRDMPAPEFFVHIDGTTATNAPAGTMYPSVGKPFHSVPGQTVQLEMDGAPFDVFLPPMALADVVPLSNTADTPVGFGPAGKARLTALFPTVDPATWDRLSVTYPAGSAVDDAGNPATQATVIPVAPNRLPAPLPPGQNPELVISVQAIGATNFDTPAPLMLPNLTELPAGEKSLIWSFNHDAGRWEVIGTGTVSLDGKTIVSDPGVGIRAPGWHFTEPGTEPEPPPKEPPKCDPATTEKLLKDAWAIAKVIGECAANLIKAKEIVGAIKGTVAILNGTFELIDQIKNLSEAIKAGDDGAAAKAIFRAIKSQKDKYAEVYKALAAQKPTDKVIGLIKCGTSLANEIAGRICDRKECLSSAGVFVCDRVKPVTDFAQKLIDEVEDLNKAISEAPLTAVCLALDEIDTLIKVTYPDPISPGSVASVAAAEDTSALEGKIAETLTGLQLIADNFTATEQLRQNVEGFDAEVADIQTRGLSPFLNDLSAYRGSYYRLNYGGFETAGRTNSAGQFDLPPITPTTPYRLEVFDFANNALAISEGTSARSGFRTVLSPFVVATLDGETDGDSDGLADAAEKVIGTISADVDSDDDGIQDRAELEQDLNPLDGRAFPSGIISSLPLLGPARNVTVENNTAYVATGSYGLAVVDASQFRNPIVLGQLDLPGDASDVAVDPAIDRAVVASNTSGVHIIDVSDPMLPAIAHVTTNVLANQVEVRQGVAYAAHGNSLTSIDLLTGGILQTLTLPGSGTVTGLAREGTRLYAFVSGSDTLSVIETGDEGAASVVGQLSVNVASTDVGLTVGNNIVYLAGSGLRTINVSNPAASALISDADLFFTARGVALNGSGIAVVASEDQGVGIYNVSDPQNTNAFLTRFDTPGFARNVAIASGIAFVADDSGGLQAINYLPFDGQGQAPTVTLATSALDVDATTPGVQVVEGTSIPLSVAVTDDVQVRNVELLVDGVVVANDVSFPFDFNPIALSQDPNATAITVQARATDTGGNTAVSNPLTIDLVPDTFAPQIQSVSPADGTKVAQGHRSIRVRFSEPLAADSLAGAFTLVGAGPNGTFGNADDVTVQAAVQLRDGDRLVQLTVDPLAIGLYRLQINQAAVTDRAGNAVGAGSFASGFEVIEAVPLLINFDAGFGTPFQYTESGLTVTSRQDHVHLGDNDFNGSPDLQNHSGCCSTPYQFTFENGAPFTVVSMMVSGGTGMILTSSSGSVVTVNATGQFTFPDDGNWSNITSFSWDQPVGQAVMDNLMILAAPVNGSAANAAVSQAVEASHDHDHDHDHDAEPLPTDAHATAARKVSTAAHPTAPLPPHIGGVFSEVPVQKTMAQGLFDDENDSLT